MPFAKAIAGFVVPYVIILLSPLGVRGDMTFEEALVVIISALATSISTAVIVYFTKNKVK